MFLLTAFGAFLVASFASAQDKTINPPTNFTYAKLSPTHNKLGWQWTPNDGIKPENIEFDVKWCLKDVCNSTKVPADGTYTAEASGLTPNATYNVTIFAQVPHHADWEPSTPLEADMLTLVKDYPTPEEVDVKVKPDTVVKTSIPYNIYWSLREKEAHNSTTVVTVCSEADTCLPAQVDPTQLSATVQVEASTSYAVEVIATYRLELNETVSKTAIYKFSSTAPERVPILDLTQLEATPEIQITWSPPKADIGRINEFRVELLVVDGKNAGFNDSITVPSSEMNCNFSLTPSDVSDGENITLKLQACNKEDLCGEQTETSLLFQGPQVATEVKIGKRETDSVEVTITPYVDNSKLFYSVNGTTFNETHFTVDGLQVYSKVSLYIMTCFGEENDAFCSKPNVVNTTTNAAAPSAVSEFNVTLKDNKPFVNWSAPEEANGPLNGYHLELQETGAANQSPITQQVDSSKTEYVFSDAADCKSYNVSIRAYNLDVNDDKTQLSGDIVYGLIETKGDCTAHKGGFPTWAIVLIVVLILLAGGGAAFYFLKMKR